MRKNIAINVLLFLIGVVLQIILIGTSPKINCNEIWNQFYIILNSLIIEYLILVATQLIFTLFITKRPAKELFFNLLFFTIFYLIVFVYLFNNYRQEICR
jgi:hypothetical protein